MVRCIGRWRTKMAKNTLSAISEGVDQGGAARLCAVLDIPLRRGYDGVLRVAGAAALGANEQEKLRGGV